MPVEFCGRLSSAEVEDLQEPFKAWLKQVLEKHRPEGDYVVVLRGTLHYEVAVPLIRVFASRFYGDEIHLQTFLQGSGEGVSFSLYIKDESDRSALIEILRKEVESFGQKESP